MAFKHDKTGQHLRTQIIKDGEQERLRAMQCLSQCYGTGSRAAIANLLLATLGQPSTMENHAGYESAAALQTKCMHSLRTSQVAKPLQQSANSPNHSLQDVSSGK